MQGHHTPHTEEAKRKCSEAQKKRWAEGKYKNRINVTLESIEKGRNTQRKGKFIICKICSNEFYCSPSKIKRGIKYCSKICNGIGMSKENHHNWKNGISRKHKLEYKSLGYSTWRNWVFKRDDYTCQNCGTTAVYLEVHHIRSFAKHPKLRFEIDNGKTLCKSCHKKVTKKEHSEKLYR